ncbi:hypothetical protein AAHE18_08G057200 [Arachis hypogaea]
MDEENSTNLGLDSANSIFDEEMVNLEDLDLDIELGSLSLNDENEWNPANILDNIGTPLFNSLVHPTLLQSDLTIEKQLQDLRSSISGNPKTHENEDTAIGHNLKGSSSIIVATRNKNQNTTEPASTKQQSVAATLGYDPSPLLQSSSNSSSPPLHPSLPKVGIILEREGSSTHQDQEYIRRMSWFNQFSHHMQHENSHRNEGGDMDYQHNNSPLVPNTISNYNLVEAGAGNGTKYHSSGQFIRNQRSVFQNNIMDTHTAFNSGSVPLPQDGFAPLPTPAPAGMYYNKIYDLNSQNSLCLTPDHPCYPRGQTKPHPSFIQVPPPNHAYNRPMLSDPTALPYYRSPPMHSSYHSHHPQPAPYPHPYATTTYYNNSFGLGSSVQPSIRCPPSYGNIYNPQTMIPQQFSRSQGVASSNHQMNGYNKYNGLLLNTTPPPHERQSYNTMMLPQEALPSSIAAMSWSQQHNIINGSQTESQALMRSTSAELFSGNTQGSSSQDSNSRGDSDDFARLLRLIRPESALGNHQEQQVTIPVSIINNLNNQVLTRQRGKGKLPQSSTTREPSAAIRRILDMSSTRTVIRNPLPNQTPLAIQTSNYPAYGSRGGWIPDLKKQVMSNSSTNSVLIRVEKEKRRRGRPRKIQPQLQPHSASSSNLGKRGRPSRSPEVDQPPYKQSSSHSTWELLNAVYDQAIENEDSPVDPFLRLFNALHLRIIK